MSLSATAITVNLTCSILAKNDPDYSVLTCSACFWALLSKPLSESLRQAASCPNDSGAGCHDDMVVVARGAQSIDKFEFEGAIGCVDLSKPISLAAASLGNWLHAFVSILRISIVGLSSKEHGRATAMQNDHGSLATRQTQGAVQRQVLWHSILIGIRRATYATEC